MEDSSLKSILPVLGTLAGAITGFLLGAVHQNVKERHQRKRLRGELSREVRANLYALPQKRQTIEFMLTNMRQGRIFPGDSVPTSRVIYTHHYPAVAPFLTQEERNLLHVVYSTLEIVDETMASYEPTVLATTASAEASGNVMKSFEHKLKDMLPALSDQEKLMKSFIDGTPIDVYHMSKPFEEVKTAKFTHDIRALGARQAQVKE